MDEEQIMKKIVNTINVQNEEFLNQNQDVNKFSKMVPHLLKKGIDNLNLSMFSSELNIDKFRLSIPFFSK